MSDIVGAALALKEIFPLMVVIFIFGGIVLAMKEGTVRGAVMAIAILMAGVMIPILMRESTGSETGDLLSDEPRQEEVFNFTVIAKGIEYERRWFLGPKKRYVLILSDGEKYPVPRDVYELYDTGDPVTITISANRREVTFR